MALTVSVAAILTLFLEFLINGRIMRRAVSKKSAGKRFA